MGQMNFAQSAHIPYHVPKHTAIDTHHAAPHVQAGSGGKMSVCIKTNAITTTINQIRLFILTNEQKLTNSLE